MSKRLKIIFALSLILNALLAGFFGGHMINAHRSPRTPSEFREIRAEMRGPINTARTELFITMRTVPFDRGQFDTRLNRLSDLQTDFNRKYMIDLNERLQRMPIDERTDAIDKMMRPRHHRSIRKM